MPRPRAGRRRLTLAIVHRSSPVSARPHVYSAFNWICSVYRPANGRQEKFRRCARRMTSGAVAQGQPGGPRVKRYKGLYSHEESPVPDGTPASARSARRRAKSVTEAGSRFGGLAAAPAARQRRRLQADATDLPSRHDANRRRCFVRPASKRSDPLSAGSEGQPRESLRRSSNPVSRCLAAALSDLHCKSRPIGRAVG